MKENQKNYRLIPDGDTRCVWMSAGILSYQLCNRSFDCDACPLDAAMKQHFPRPESGETEDSRQLPSEMSTPPGVSELRHDCRYTQTHFWVRSLSERRYRVGIEAGLAQALTIPKTIILPEIGENLTQSQPCLWFILDETTVPLCAFAGGTVTERNSLLGDRPYKVYYHPYDQGWLFEFTMTGDLRPKMLSAQVARHLYDDHQQIFKEKLQIALQGSTVGMTLQDGGQLLQNLPSMLGPKRYFDLLRDSFLKEKKRK